MAKFRGKVGFIYTVESDDPEYPGVFVEHKVEKIYRGDILEYNRRWKSSDDTTNDTLTLSEQISILANDYAIKHRAHMKYVVLDGIKWKITSINIKRPRLILNLGGVYNGG